MLSARDALQQLREGNARFVKEVTGGGPASLHPKRTQLPTIQEPSAVILGCSDARVPAEIVFDQGLGDLFVIRVAGNVVASSQVGSVEFAVERFGTRLVVVLGHSQCGAIAATLEALQGGGAQSRGLRSIVDRVRPSVESLLETDLRNDRPSLVHHAVRSNIRMSVHQLRYGSEILEHHIQANGLMVVGAQYSLDTGEVDFFDGL